MKEDLMVGDFVYLINTSHNVSFLENGVIQDEGYTTIRIPIKITTVSENCVSYYSNKLESYVTLSFEDIEPIPVTPEILEKNEFKNIDNMYPFPTFRSDDKEKYFCITIGFPEGDTTRRKHPFIEINGKNIFVEYIKINFVHELQHALKLCGIDKEIII